MQVVENTAVAGAESLAQYFYRSYNSDATMDPKTFGERVRQIRDFRDMTLDVLAERAGLDSRQTVNKIEKGRRRRLPTAEVIERIAKALSVSASDLADDSVQLDLAFRPKAADESGRGTHLGKEHLLVPDEVYLDCAAAIKVGLRYDKELARAFRDDLPSVIQDWLNRRLAASGQ